VIRWTPEAANDFRAIREYIAADNLEAAFRQCDLIADSIAQLARFPLSGKPRLRGTIRQLAVPNTAYTIYYRQRPEAIVLLGILHGAMRVPRRLRK